MTRAPTLPSSFDPRWLTAKTTSRETQHGRRENPLPVLEKEVDVQWKCQRWSKERIRKTAAPIKRLLSLLMVVYILKPKNYFEGKRRQQKQREFCLEDWSIRTNTRKGALPSITPWAEFWRVPGGRKSRYLQLLSVTSVAWHSFPPASTCLSLLRTVIHRSRLTAKARVRSHYCWTLLLEARLLQIYIYIKGRGCHLGPPAGR